MAMITHGSAHWSGGIKDGSGTIDTRSGALSGQPYGFATRFEGKPGTNPEELIGAAHAACFSMALSLGLTEAGVTGIDIASESHVTLEKGDGGFAVTAIRLKTTVKGQGDRAAIEAAAHKAKDNCPISKLLDAPITFDLTVA